MPSDHTSVLPLLVLLLPKKNLHTGYENHRDSCPDAVESQSLCYGKDFMKDEDLHHN